MKNVLRLVALAMIFCLLSLCLISCEKSRVHTVGELSLKVPEKLRVSHMEGYDLYLSTMECALSVQKLNDETLAETGLSVNDGLEALVDNYFVKNKIDKSQCYLTYVEEQNAYKFRYSITMDKENYYFHYIVMVGGKEAVYFIDMICDYEKSLEFLPEFDKWGNTAKLN
jgi:hypothetical protein